MAVNENNTIEDLKFTSLGYALCLASTDLIIEIVREKTIEHLYLVIV